jgi:hypothetical protein
MWVAYARATSQQLPCHVACTPLLQGKAAEATAMAGQAKLNRHSLPVRAYLDQTVVPVLCQGLTQLSKERCARGP